MHHEQEEDFELVKAPTAFERHFQTLITSLALAAICWLVYTTSELKSNTAVLSERMDAIRAQVATANGDKYTGAQAAADLRFRDLEVKNLEARVERLEKTLEVKPWTQPR